MTANVITFSNIPINYDMIYKYANVFDKQDEFSPIIEECLNEVKNKLTYKVCYLTFPITKIGDTLDLGFSITSSKKLIAHLDGCNEIILLASTIGIEIDILIKKYNHLSPLKALVFEAIGTERIESTLNEFCLYIQNELKPFSKGLKPRFSPGYGDLPITLQKDIFNALNCPKHLGLTLNDSMLMSPSKSVTAIVGVYGK